MKHSISIIAFLLLSACILNAQVELKPAAGFNLTDFSKDASTGKYKSRVGYQLGGSIAIGNKVYIEPGAYYLRRSTKLAEEGTHLSNVKYDISGVYVPVTLGAHFIGNEKTLFGLRGFAGGSAFFLTEAKGLNRNDCNSPNWGVFAGLGADIGFLFVDAKYEWSLTNLQKNITDIDVGKTRGIMVNAGIRIPLNGPMNGQMK